MRDVCYVVPTGRESFVQSSALRCFGGWSWDLIGIAFCYEMQDEINCEDDEIR
jgi:hypothetical protein